MKIKKVGYINNIGIETARRVANVLDDSGYVTEIVKTDIDKGFELVIYIETKKTRKWYASR